MADLMMTIDGRPREGSDRFEVINPALGEPFATAPTATPAILDEAMGSAALAFRSWRRDDEHRCELLLQAAAALTAAAPEIGALLTQEQGRPLEQAVLEVHGAAVWFAHYASLQVEREVLRDDETGLIEVRRRPIGVVAAIAPWNYPLLLACWKLAPALRAGNTVVLKPSPYTPLSSLRMVEVLNGILPEGVLNIVTGGDQLGAWMTSHPTPRKVSFTGSVSSGKKVAAAAAADLKRMTLELGGNDAAIVMPDADPAAVAAQLFSVAMANAGQTCVAVKRVFVPAELHDELVDALVAQAEATVVGDGRDPATTMGPINNRAQYDRVVSLLDDARASGGTAAAGGAPLDRPGYFVPPTIVTGLAEGSRLVDEEQFGPVLPILAYDDLDDAVERANDTAYGLGGSVWGTDVAAAEVVARQLDCGTAWVNAHAVLLPEQPFGGVKWSGLGVENGVRGLEAFADLQVIHRKNSLTPLGD